MFDPAWDTATGALIDQVRTRYHDTRRRDLPDLITPARTVETAHASDLNTPHGLTHSLAATIPDAETRMVAADVTHLRLMPPGVDMVTVAQVFRDATDRRAPVDGAEARLVALTWDAGLTNGCHRGAAGYRRIAATAPI